jgi:hypothetical protein
VKKSGISVIAVVIFIIAATAQVSAGDDALFLSTDAAHYRFSLNENSQIPVKITNTMDKDLPGTLVVKIKDPQTGEYVHSQSKRVTAFSGEEMYYVSAGNAGGENDLIVDISFEYGNGPVYSSDLKGITLSFSDEPAPDEETETETETAPVKSTSEIKAEDTATDTSSYRPEKTDGEANPVEKHSDADALKRTLLEEQIERELRKNALTASITDDILFQNVNRTLYDQNFTRLSLVVTPQGNQSGVFASLYRDTNDEEISLSGTVNEGRIADIFENTSALIALPGIFLENETFTSLLSQTASKGYLRSGTKINLSPRYSDVTVLYTKGIYAAEIRATYENGTLTSVSLREDDIVPFYVLPILILIFTSLNAGLMYVYYTRRPNRSGKRDSAESQNDVQTYDTMDMLHTAESLFQKGYQTEAISMAVRALRMNISSEECSGRELSDRECRNYLLENADPQTSEQTIRILTATEQQRFSGEEITEGEFTTLIAEIRSLIQH